MQSRLVLSLLDDRLGLDKIPRRVRAVRREDCPPCLRMRAWLWLDMTDDAAFETDIAGLVYELRQSPEASPPLAPWELRFVPLV